MKNKFVFLLFCALAYFANETNAQYFELTGFKFGAYPKARLKDATSDISFSFLEYSAFVNFPVQLKNKKTILLNGLDYTWVKSTAHDIPNPAGIIEEEQFYGISYNVNIKHEFSSQWSILTMLKPTLASDFESELNETYFIFQAASLVKYSINDLWSFGGGLAYTMRFGKPTLIPLILLDYTHGKHRFNAVLPTKANYEYSLENKNEISFGAQFVANGGQFYIANTQTLNMSDIEKLTYTRANAGIHFKYRIKGLIQFTVAAGISNRRQYYLFDSAGKSYNYDLQQAPVFSVGIALLPKKQ